MNFHHFHADDGAADAGVCCSTSPPGGNMVDGLPPVCIRPLGCRVLWLGFKVYGPFDAAICNISKY